MDISYLGHSSFRIKGRTGVVVTDPYDSEMVGLKYPKVSGDIVTVSHYHKDHDNSESVSGKKIIIDGPGEYEVAGISIIGIKTYHDEKKGDERGKNTVFIVEIDDIRIAHLGDLGHKLSDKQLDLMGDINVLMVPVGGTYTIGPFQAVEIVKEMEPSIVIPMHYRVSGLRKELFDKLLPVEDFLSEVGLPVERQSKLPLKPGDLDEVQKTVVLTSK